MMTKIDNQTPTNLTLDQAFHFFEDTEYFIVNDEEYGCFIPIDHEIIKLLAGLSQATFGQELFETVIVPQKDGTIELRFDFFNPADRERILTFKEFKKLAKHFEPLTLHSWSYVECIGQLKWQLGDRS